MKNERMGRLLGVAALLVFAVLGSCATATDFEAVKRTNRNLDKTISELNGYLDTSEAKIAQLTAENSRLQQEAGDANWVRQQREKLKRLLEEFRAKGVQQIPGGKDYEVIQRPGGGVGVRIPGDLLFPSGKATLTAGGKSALKRLLPVLRSDGRSLEIVGHTDTDPIRRSKWPSNLDLSVARSLAVAHALKKLGIPWERMVSVGKGSSEPAGPGKRVKGKDRRVEIFFN